MKHFNDLLITDRPAKVIYDFDYYISGKESLPCPMEAEIIFLRQTSFTCGLKNWYKITNPSMGNTYTVFNKYYI